MFKILYTSLLQLMCLSSIAQQLGSIDKIKSDENVIAFFNKIENTNKIELCSPTIHFYDTIVDVYGILQPKNWFTGDFDGNGYTDILAKIKDGADGYCSYKCVLSFGKDSIYSLYTYNNDLTFYSPFENKSFKGIKRYYKDDIYSYFTVVGDDSVVINRPILDTLVFFKKYLLEYNHKLGNYSIEKIEFEAGPCLGMCPVFTMRIDANGTLEFDGQGSFVDSLSGYYTSKIDLECYNNLLSILNYINFPLLQDDYSASWTCDATYTLKITYDNGKVKEISDYGGQGTLGLIAVYKEIFKLKESQKWIKKGK